MRNATINHSPILKSLHTLVHTLVLKSILKLCFVMLSLALFSFVTGGFRI